MVDGRFDFARWGEAFTAELFPLWMLKYLPNMPACHIGIAQDARGPNNTVTLGDVSTLSAVAEAARVLERGQADVMIAGGASSRIHHALWARNQVLGQIAVAAAIRRRPRRPFDARRDGLVNGEGSAALDPGNARARRRTGRRDSGAGPRLRRRLRASHERRPLPGHGHAPGDCRGAATPPAASPRRSALSSPTALAPSTATASRPQAIRETLGDVPVTAPKSYYGYLGAAAGSLEAVLCRVGIPAWFGAADAQLRTSRSAVPG